MGGEGNCARLLAGERGGMASFAGARAGVDSVCGCCMTIGARMGVEDMDGVTCR